MSESNSEKQIFQYFDGFTKLFADPFEVDYKIQKASELEDMKLLDKWIADLPHDEDGTISEKANEGQIKLYQEACFRYVPIIQKGFDLKPFDKSTGEGLTSAQVLDLYGEYLIWKFSLKKSTE